MLYPVGRKVSLQNDLVLLVITSAESGQGRHVTGEAADGEVAGIAYLGVARY